MFAQTLQHALQKKRWSARELARRLDRDNTTVSRWLANETIPNEDVLRPLAKLLGLNLTNLRDEYLVELAARETTGRKSSTERLDELEERFASLETRIEALLEQIIAETRGNGVRKSR